MKFLILVFCFISSLFVNVHSVKYIQIFNCNIVNIATYLVQTQPIFQSFKPEDLLKYLYCKDDKLLEYLILLDLLPHALFHLGLPINYLYPSFQDKMIEFIDSMHFNSDNENLIQNLKQILKNEISCINQNGLELQVLYAHEYDNFFILDKLKRAYEMFFFKTKNKASVLQPYKRITDLLIKEQQRYFRSLIKEQQRCLRNFIKEEQQYLKSLIKKEQNLNKIDLDFSTILIYLLSISIFCFIYVYYILQNSQIYHTLKLLIA